MTNYANSFQKRNLIIFTSSRELESKMLQLLFVYKYDARIIIDDKNQEYEELLRRENLKLWREGLGVN